MTIFGASHSEELGIVLSGVPAGVILRAEDFASDLERRRPQSKGETPRHEADEPIIEGVDAEGVTTGDSVTIKFRNTNCKSGDYSHLRLHPRPSHADLTQRMKYGQTYNLAGGGMASGRMTVALVAAGVVAKKILSGYSFRTELVSVGGVTNKADFEGVIAEARLAGDSVGGVVECRVSGVERGLGEPFFDSVESVISHLMFSIPGVKGIEFGDGFEGAKSRGSERNDVIVNDEGKTKTNNDGGINGGIANGNDIVLRVAIKPTPSIAKAQQTFNFESNSIEELRIGGRHDSCIARRAMVIVEAMTAFALADLRLQQNGNS